ncbi:uncharacterized protein LOC127093855 [Lathyrus oleraceus]|uniref:uncharacterized protein LOC127093855 n=1 Tax=Pisum sativum TaxID=3888 RepID=UPI0021D3B819|nr:uncharacterized protein LOC127093855 [Pisum sativum]
MLLEEVEDWWDNARQRLEIVGTEITWVVFRVHFLEKYFLEDVRSKKEIEFLELKQGNSTVTKYVAKFKKLVKFCPYYNGAAAEGSKCIKIRSAYYKSFSGKKREDQNRGKPYNAPAYKGKQKADQKAIGGKQKSGGGTHTSMRCFKCGEFGHRAPERKSTIVNFSKCGKPGH